MQTQTLLSQQNEMWWSQKGKGSMSAQSAELEEIRTLIDPKIFDKAPVFNGNQKDFEEWFFQFSAILGLLGLEDDMNSAANAAKEEDLVLQEIDDDKKSVAKVIWFLLVSVMRGNGQIVIKNAERYNGYIAWHRLIKEYRPRVRGRYSMLMRCLRPTHWTGSKQPFAELLETWTGEIKSYCEQSGDAMTDRTTIAVVGLYAAFSAEHAVMLATT
jgi:hypothetical protein